MRNTAIKSNKAFTLIELIVVMAIIAILVLLAAPRFTGYVKESRVTAMKQDVRVLADASREYELNENTWPAENYGPTKAEAADLLHSINTTSEDLNLTTDDLRAISKDKLSEHVRTIANDWDKFVIVTSENDYEGDVFYLDGVSGLEEVHFSTNDALSGPLDVNKKSYTVTFKNGDEVLGIQDVLERQSAVAPKEPNKEGYDFIGWDKEFDIITSDLTVNAEWKANSRTFTFDLNGGESVDKPTITQIYNTPIGDLPNATRAGYTFVGWFTEKVDGRMLSPESLVTANKTYYAQWEQNNIQTKTFTLPEGMTAEQVHDIAIDGLYEITSISVDDGQVDIESVDKDAISIKLSGRSSDRRVQTGGELITADSKEVSGQTSSTYNRDGYTGNLTRYHHSGSYTPSHTKSVSGQSSSNYNSGGYTGTLSRYLYSGSYTPADSKRISEETYWGYEPFSENPNSMSHRANKSYSEARASALAFGKNYMGDTKSYNSGGYSGTLTVTSYRAASKAEAVHKDYWGYEQGDVTGYITYTGTVNRPASDTRTYRYRGDVTRPASDTRVYRYKGTVNRPHSDTRTWDNFYQYKVEVEYRLK